MDNIYIDKVLSGDIEAFRYFIKTYKDMGFNLAVSIIKDEQYAEEIVQDAFMKAFKGLKSFKRTAKFKSWFYRIVVNEAFQRLRSNKRGLQLNYLEESDKKLLKYQADDTQDERIDKIRAVLKMLPPKEGLVLNLFYLEETSVKDIGKITGWTTSNIKVILHRARKNTRLIWQNNMTSYGKI
jgi:RNA polymerase sigma-70 factor (ECF subfamily)